MLLTDPVLSRALQALDEAVRVLEGQALDSVLSKSQQALLVGRRQGLLDAKQVVIDAMKHDVDNGDEGD